MQFQIECNDSSRQHQWCWMCDQTFPLEQARVILCNESGDRHGDVCPDCISMGFSWLSQRYQQLTQPRRLRRSKERLYEGKKRVTELSDYSAPTLVS